MNKASRWLHAAVLLALVAGYFAYRLPVLDRSRVTECTEQREFGLLARDLLAGPVLPLGAYKSYPREGCTFLFGAACAPLFALAGPSMSSLRLCALIWNGATLLVFALVALLVAGVGGALLVGLLWVFAPDLVVHLAHFGWPNHLELTLFLGISLLCLLLAVRRAGRTGPRLFSLAGGLAGGLAIFFHLTGLPAVVVLLLVAIYAAAKRSGPSAGFYFLGLLMGLLPFVASPDFALILLAPVTDSAALSRAVDAVFDSYMFTGLGFVGNLADFFQEGLWRVWGLGRFGHRWQGACYWAALGVLILLGVMARRDNALVWSKQPRRRCRCHLAMLASGSSLLVYIACFLLLGVELTGPTSRYFTLVWPYLLLLCAPAAMLRFNPRQVGRVYYRVRLLGMGLVVLATAALCWHDQITRRLAAPGDYQVQRHLRGYSYVHHTIGRRLAALPSASLLGLIEQRPLDRGELLLVAGWASYYSILDSQEDDQRRFGGHRFLRSARSYVVEGEGQAAGNLACRYNLCEFRDATLDLLKRAMRQMPEDLRISLVLGMATPFRVALDDERHQRFMRTISQSTPSRLWPVLCAASGLYQCRQGKVIIPADPPSGAPSCHGREVAAGLGLGLARELLDPKMPPPPAKLLKERYPVIGSSPAAAASFHCVFEAERARLKVLASAVWSKSPALPHPLQQCGLVPAGNGTSLGAGKKIQAAAQPVGWQLAPNK